ncbi:MAG TPA: A24 family peptidase [bacterium]|nr:A24 family peptidase [bacterium]HQP98253.1 A24 family peptidase [bacterium]
MSPEIVIASAVLGIAAIIDWKEHRVPNWLTFSAWGLAVIYHTAHLGFAGFVSSLAGAVVGLTLLIVPYALSGMGAGDVKLMAAVGAWVGAAATIHAFLWIAVFGGVMGLYSILRSGEFAARLGILSHAAMNLLKFRRLDLDLPDHAPVRILLPYGVPIAIGFYAYFVFGGLI